MIVAPAVLAIDLGGTMIKGAVVDARGVARLVHTAPTFPPGSPDALRGLLGMLDRLAAGLPALCLEARAAGIVVPGLIEESSAGGAGRVIFAANLGWRDLELGAVAARHLGMPVAIGHDVRASGLAESLFGVARGRPHIVMVTIGTGIAAALLSSGQAISGASHAAGEMGHIPVIADGEACACGQRGCLEAYASAASIARRYRAAGGLDGLTADAIATRLGHDKLAALVWGEAVHALSLALATATLLLDPDLIVIGGGLSRAGATLLDPLRADLAGRLAWRAPPPLAVSALGSTAGRIGAAVLGWRRIGDGTVPDGWTAAAVLSQPLATPV